MCTACSDWHDAQLMGVVTLETINAVGSDDEGIATPIAVTLIVIFILTVAIWAALR